MNSKIGFLLAGLLPAFIYSSHLAHAVTLGPGDIVIATQIGPTVNKDYGLVVVDPVTGNRTILSDNTIGSGPSFTQPEGIAIEPDGDLLVTDPLAGPGPHSAIFRVDPATGDRTIISTEGGVGTGATMIQPSGILESHGTIYVAAHGRIGGGDPGR